MKNYEYPIMIYDGKNLIEFGKSTYKNWIDRWSNFYSECGFDGFIFRGSIILFRKLKGKTL